MVQRKKRVPVVLDTNVFVRALKASSPTNWNRRIVRLWLIERQLQLIVSAELIAEYLGIFADVLGMDTETVAEWRNRFEIDGRSSLVNLGRRYSASRDPDDNLLLATATAGDARFLITNDRDLLEVPDDVKQTLKYAIVKPQEFLKLWDAE
jgi:putative PIN family toxin of toxin-antitoxin system